MPREQSVWQLRSDAASKFVVLAVGRRAERCGDEFQFYEWRISYRSAQRVGTFATFVVSEGDFFALMERV